jgi:molybdopterin-guanine dinucleotide biosynthesis protein A
MRLREALRTAILQEEIRKVDRWTRRYNLAVADFTVKGIDPFFNVNQPGDLKVAENWLNAK